MGAVATTIALGAFVITVCQLRSQQRHDKLSVKPYLTDHTNVLETPTGYTYSYILINNGLGPAMIKSFGVFHNGVALPWTDDTDLKVTILGILEVGEVTHIRIFREKSALAAGESCKMFEYHLSKAADAGIESIKQKMDSLEVRISYQSMYAEDMEPYTSSLAE